LSLSHETPATLPQAITGDADGGPLSIRTIVLACVKPASNTHETRGVQRGRDRPMTPTPTVATTILGVVLAIALVAVVVFVVAAVFGGQP